MSLEVYRLFMCGIRKLRLGKFTGVFGSVKRIYSQSGFLGLYRGHSATIARIFPYAAINFAAFEKFKLVLNAEQNQNHQNDWPWRKLVAGSLAGTIAVAVTYPFDIIRARIAFSLVTKSDTLDNQTKGFKSILQQLSNEGRLLTQSQTPLRGFYQGFVPTILGIIPYAGVSFFVFESSKQITAPVECKNICIANILRFRIWRFC